MKRIVSYVLALACVIACQAPVMAAEQPQPNVPTSTGIDIRPQYMYITIFSLSGSKSGSTITGKSSGNINPSGASANLTVYVDRSTNGSSYSYWKTLGSDKGAKRAFAVNSSVSGATSSYTYRLRAVFTVYDSSGKVIDSDTDYKYL